MKKVFFTLLMVFCAIVGMSQTIGEAFYVYRNDGMINTFFRSEIDSIAYSYYDADSLIYDEIVSQVVYTQDSIYQIPLAVIDSVGFVTPETKYQPGVIRLEAEIRNYIIGSDSLTVFFRSDTPSSILPKVGDKLVTTEMSDVFAGGFIGQVERMEHNGDTIFIHCDAIGIEEVFECFYYSTNGVPQNNPNKARALEWDWNNYYAPGPFAFSFTSFLDANFTPIDCPFNVSPKLDVAIAPTFKSKGSIIVHPLRGVVISMDIKQHTSLTMDMAVSGEKNVKRDFAPEFMPMYPILPFVYFYGDVGFFIEGNLKVALEEHLNQSLDYNIHYEASYLPVFPLPITTSIPKFKITNVNLTTEHNTKFMLDGYIAGGIFGEIGIVPFLTKHIAKAGFRFEGGIKLGGDVIIYNSDGMNTLSSTSPYERLKSGELYVKPFCRIGMGARLLGVGKGEVNLFEKDWDLGRYKLVPDFTNTKLTRNEDTPSTLIATTTAFGSTIFPCSLGFKMFDGAENDGFKGIYSHSYLGITGEPETYWDSFLLMPLTKNYSVYPTVELFGKEMLASPSAELDTSLKPVTLHVEDITETTAKVWGKIEGHELLDETTTFGLGYEEVGGTGTFSFDASSIDSNGVFSVDFLALKPKTKYKYFAYLTIDGDTYYGEDREFTTKEEEKREAYYVWNAKDSTAIFYYDGMQENRGGRKMDSWRGYYKNRCVNVIFDISFSNYYPHDFDFSGCFELRRIENISYLKTDSIDNMEKMFYQCRSLTSLDLSSFNTSNVTNMEEMFLNCSSLTSLDLSSFNTSNVTNMEEMFLNCSSLTSLDLSSFNTSNVTNMEEMFYICSSLTSLDLNSFNTSNVTSMRDMFWECDSLTSLDLSSFNTSNVKDMSHMFTGCSSLTSLDLSSFNTSNVTNMEAMFSHCSSLTSLDLSSFNTSNVKNMDTMFAGCASLTSLDLSSFNTSNVTDMGAMFVDCSSLTSLDLSSFNTSNVTNMRRMFVGCSSLTSLVLSSFNTSNVTNMEEVFLNCSSLTSLDLSSFNTSNVTNMSHMFCECSFLTSLDLSSFNTSNVEDMHFMFYGCSSLTSLDLSSFNTSNVTNMSAIFGGCRSLKTIFAGDWNVMHLDDYLFGDCFNLVGGKGTHIGSNLYGYDNNGQPLYYNCPDDGRAAHIDGGKDNPGLFTAK